MRLVEVEYFAKKYKIAVCAMSDRLHHQKINTCVTVTEEKVLYESLLLFQNGGCAAAGKHLCNCYQGKGALRPPSHFFLASQGSVELK